MIMYICNLIYLVYKDFPNSYVFFFVLSLNFVMFYCSMMISFIELMPKDITHVSIYRVFFKIWVCGILIYNSFLFIAYNFFIISNWHFIWYLSELFVLETAAFYIFFSIYNYFFPLYRYVSNFKKEEKHFLNTGLPSKELILKEEHDLFLEKVRKNRFYINLKNIFIFIFLAAILVLLVFCVVVILMISF